MKKTLFEDIKRMKDLMFQEDDFETEDNVDVDETYEEMTEEGEETTSTTSADAGPSQGYPTVGKWESGRTFGPTYKFPYAKWDNGLVRGKGNKLV